MTVSFWRDTPLAALKSLIDLSGAQVPLLALIISEAELRANDEQFAAFCAEEFGEPAPVIVAHCALPPVPLARLHEDAVNYAAAVADEFGADSPEARQRQAIADALGRALDAVPAFAVGSYAQWGGLTVRIDGATAAFSDELGYVVTLIGDGSTMAVRGSTLTAIAADAGNGAEL